VRANRPGALALKLALDTNAYVAFAKGDPATRDVIAGATALVVPHVVLGELLFGFYNGSRPTENVERLNRLLEAPLVEDPAPTRATADRYGRLSAELRRRGTPIPTNDVWIAAQTLETAASLVTFDAHFDGIPGLITIRPGDPAA